MEKWERQKKQSTLIPKNKKPKKKTGRYQVSAGKRNNGLTMGLVSTNMIFFVLIVSTRLRRTFFCTLGKSVFFGSMANSSPFWERMNWRRLDFHEEAALCHINGIFLYDFNDVHIWADGHHQLEYVGFVSCYLSGEIAGLVVARHVLVELPILGRDHCGRCD